MSDGKIDGKFVINQGGITQGIASELGLTGEECNKIGKSIWNQIIQEFDNPENMEVQNNNGQKANSSNNYLVHKDAVVSFSQACWQKIVGIINKALDKNIEIDEVENAQDTEELTAEEQAEFDALNLEFKVVNYNEKYLMKNSSDSEGETYTSIDAMSIENDENDAIYTTEGWSDQLIMSENNVWEYNSSSTQTVKEIVILVRQKADENTIQSPAMYITYLVSYEYIETV